MVGGRGHKIVPGASKSLYNATAAQEDHVPQGDGNGTNRPRSITVPKCQARGERVVTGETPTSTLRVPPSLIHRGRPSGR